MALFNYCKPRVYVLDSYQALEEFMQEVRG